MTGATLVRALHETARRHGVTMIDNARLVTLLTDGDRVIGLEIQVLGTGRLTRLAHTALYRVIDTWAVAARRVPRALSAILAWFEARCGTRARVRALRGVILATGGFSYNRDMLDRYAPAYARAMPLGTPGDDGSGIRCAQAIGAGVRLMDRCAASRFYAPPIALCSGVLVDEHGERICDESLYASTLSARIADRGERAWLVVDDAARDDAREQIRSGARLRARTWRELASGRANHVLFPKLFGRVNLFLNRRRASTVAELAAKCDLPVGVLTQTIAGYNECARAGGADAMGKPARYLRPLDRAPFWAIPCDLDSIVFPAPCITLGGLDVDRMQRVRRADGSTIGGLYAVGRCAAGVASRSYVSGLSLADCVFSGRNAGRAVSGTPSAPTPSATTVR